MECHRLCWTQGRNGNFQGGVYGSGLSLINQALPVVELCYNIIHETMSISITNTVLRRQAWYVEVPCSVVSEGI